MWCEKCTFCRVVAGLCACLASIVLFVLFKSVFLIDFFCLLLLFITVMSVLEYFIVIIDLSIYPCKCVHLCFTYTTRPFLSTFAYILHVHIINPARHQRLWEAPRAAWCASSPGIMKHLLSLPFVILLPKRGHLVHPFHSPQFFFSLEHQRVLWNVNY